MSRFVLGNCIDVMTRIPDNAIDFILTDPPYLVGFRDRSGRTIAGDKTDEWLQPACNEMYRVLKKDALMVSFYGWNRVDRFMAAWKNAGFSVVGHLVFTKNYTSKAAYVGYRHECAYILAKGRPRLPQNPLPDVLGWKYSGNRHHPTEKPVTSLQPLIESFTHPNAIMAAWKNAGFSVVGHLVFTKNYTSKAAYVGYRHECAYILAKGRPRLPQNPLPDVLGWKYSGNRHHPTEKPVTSLQPLIESFTHPNAIFSDERPSSRFRGIALPSKRRRLRYSTVGLTRYRTR